MADDKKAGLMESVKKRVSGAMRARASWALTDDGKRIASAGVQDKTKQQIREILQATIADADARKDLGLELPAGVPIAAPAAPDIDSKDLALMLLELISRGAVKGAERAGYTPTVAIVVALTPDEQRKLAPAAAKVIDKYLPQNLGKYAEEIGLLIAIGGVAAAKVQLLREADARSRGNPVPVAVPAAA